MNCPNCGNEVRGNFCTNCGTRMDEASPPPPSEVDPGATAVIRPGDLTNLAERESAGQQPSGMAGGDLGATAKMRPEDLQGTGPGAQQPYGTPGMAPEGQQPYGPGTGPAPAGGAPPSGGNWARELGVAPQSSSGGAAGGPPGAPQRLNYPGGVSIVVPPGLQQALAPLEGAGKQVIAWVGAVLLFIGTFLATKTYSISAGIYSASGSHNLWDWASFIWPLLLVLLAAASAGFAFIRDYKWLVVTGGVSLLILILEFLYTFSTGVSIPGLSAHPSWGWIVLFPAALLIIAAGVTRATARDAQDDQGLEKLLGQARNRTGAK